MQSHIAPARHQHALNQIAQCIRDCPDTGGGVQLRRFLWSLYNQHHSLLSSPQDGRPAVKGESKRQCSRGLAPRPLTSPSVRHRS